MKSLQNSNGRETYYQLDQGDFNYEPVKSLATNDKIQTTLFQQTISPKSDNLSNSGYLSRSFVTDETFYIEDIPAWASWWIKGKWFILAYLFIQPFLLYDLQTIWKCSFVTFMSFFAGCIPSSGTPVAGGIVFIPVLKMCDVSTSSSVAFCAVIQSVGCGISNPLNWYSKDPSVLIRTTYLYTIPASILGLLGAMFLFPIHDTIVDFYFMLFCVFLLCSVIYGLHHKLDTQDKPVTFPSLWTKEGVVTLLVYTCTMFIGGLLAGWIGLGLEKVFFSVVTTYHQADCKRANVTAITLIGWLSWVSAILHIFYRRDVPYDYMVCSLPVMLLGTFAGPHLNQLLGSKNILIIFCAFLCCTILEEMHKLYW